MVILQNRYYHIARRDSRVSSGALSTTGLHSSISSSEDFISCIGMLGELNKGTDGIRPARAVRDSNRDRGNPMFTSNFLDRNHICLCYLLPSFSSGFGENRSLS